MQTKLELENRLMRSIFRLNKWEYNTKSIFSHNRVEEYERVFDKYVIQQLPNIDLKEDMILAQIITILKIMDKVDSMTQFEDLYERSKK